MPARHVDWHDDWIIANYLNYESYNDMVADYNILFNDHVTKAGMNNHCRYKLKLHKPRQNCRHYTDEQRAWLTENLPKYGRNETCRMFNERFNESRSVRSMKSFTAMYGVKVDEQVWKKHVVENANKNKLKEIGTERIDHGRPVVKVGGSDWRYKNRLVYEEAHGKIPKGCAIIHLDNDPLNCDIDNLKAVPKDRLGALIAADMKSEIPQITEAGLLWLELGELLGVKNK